MRIDPATGQIIQDEKGREVPDPQPLEIPSGMKRPETLIEMVRRLTRTELSKAADEQGFDTFEEADDFEIDDDMFDPSSPYEEVFDPRLNRGITVEEFHKNYAEYEKRYQIAQEQADMLLEASDILRARKRKSTGTQPPPREGEGAGGARREPPPPIPDTPGKKQE